VGLANGLQRCRLMCEGLLTLERQAAELCMKNRKSEKWRVKSEEHKPAQSAIYPLHSSLVTFTF
jgi:hypothetical protein